MLIKCKLFFLALNSNFIYEGGAHGIMVIVIGSELNYQSSNPELGYLHFI